MRYCVGLHLHAKSLGIAVVDTHGYPAPALVAAHCREWI